MYTLFQVDPIIFTTPISYKTYEYKIMRPCGHEFIKQSSKLSVRKAEEFASPVVIDQSRSICARPFSCRDHEYIHKENRLLAVILS
jgi:hypothetical protein